MTPIQNITQSWKLIISTILLLIVITCPIKGQVINLIPDPSFEDTLPTVGYLTPEALKWWQNVDSNNLIACRSLYFSLTTPQTVLRLPNTQWFYQFPKSGGGAVGLENTFYNFPSEFRRSLVKCKLSQKLIAGKTYYAKLHCVPGERFYTRFTDGISMYFDNGQLDTMVSVQKDSTGIYAQVVPQVINPYGNVITDTVNWTKIEGCFVANGTETYLTIGNFKSNANTAWTPNLINAGSDPWSGFLIDDVSVYPIDLANWLPPTYGYPIGDSALIGLPNYETPDAKWYTYNMVLIDSGSQIKVLPPVSGTKYICGIDMCNTMVFDTVEVVQWALANYELSIMNYQLKLYPNPATNTIEVNHIIGDKVYLYNAVGAVVLEQNVVQNKATIDVAYLPKGLYFVKDKSRVVKVVKE
jgi:Secretion system C-terminal sorting domain